MSNIVALYVEVPIGLEGAPAEELIARGFPVYDAGFVAQESLFEIESILENK